MWNKLFGDWNEFITIGKWGCMFVFYLFITANNHFLGGEFCSNISSEKITYITSR